MRECGSANEAMFHSGKLTFGDVGVCATKIICDDQPQHRVAQELECLIVKLARLFFVPWSDLLMRPRAVRHCAFKQGPIAKAVTES